MAGGFDTLNVGDRVLCTPPLVVDEPDPDSEKDHNPLFSEPSESDSDSDVSSLGSPRTAQQAPSFRGEIIGMQK